MSLNYSGPSGSPLRVLRPVLVSYVHPLESLIGVIDGALDRGFVPQYVFGVEAGGLRVGPVFAFSVSGYVPLFPLFVFVDGKIRGALGPKVNGFRVVNYSLEFFVLSI